MSKPKKLDSQVAVRDHVRKHSKKWKKRCQKAPGGKSSWSPRDLSKPCVRLHTKDDLKCNSSALFHAPELKLRDDHVPEAKTVCNWCHGPLVERQAKTIRLTDIAGNLQNVKAYGYFGKEGWYCCTGHRAKVEVKGAKPGSGAPWAQLHPKHAVIKDHDGVRCARCGDDLKPTHTDKKGRVYLGEGGNKMNTKRGERFCLHCTGSPSGGAYE